MVNLMEITVILQILARICFTLVSMVASIQGTVNLEWCSILMHASALIHHNYLHVHILPLLNLFRPLTLKVLFSFIHHTVPYFCTHLIFFNCPPLAPFSCDGKPDGNYPDPSNPCSNTFYTCSNGIAYQRNCYPGLVYDLASDQCVYSYQLPSCGATPSTRPPPTTVIPRKLPFVSGVLIKY